MKRALAWFAGLVGVAAAGRALLRRRHAPPPVVETPAEAPPDLAEELRRTLDAQRTADAAAEPVETSAEPTPETLDERRARVHAKAREAIASMGDGPDADEGPAA
jgi:hypothetical protein